MDSELGAPVGRERELAMVGRILDAARSPPARILQVTGEPGIGKTRLIAEVGALADERGYGVDSGRGAEFERMLPFGLFVDALDDRLAVPGSIDLDELSAEWRAQLAAVFPALAGLEPASAASVTGDRHRAHYAIRALLEQLARTRPMALMLDDAHWADEASLELLAHLIRVGIDAPILLTVAYRTSQAPAKLVSALNDAERMAAAERIELNPLSESEAGALLGSGLDVEARRSIYAESGGNPFYLEELARGALSGDRADTGAGLVGSRVEPPDVPGAVAAALAAELAALPEPARQLAFAAAIAGESFERGVVGEIANVHGDAGVEALDTLIDRDLIRPTGAASFRFRHPIVRRAVYDSISPAWLVAAHARAAAVLEDRGASAVLRAHHVERSAERGDDDAIALLTEAANASLGLAPATAARYFESALRLLGPDAPAARRISLMVPRAWALALCGNLSTSDEILREVLFLLPADDPARIQVVTMLAAVDHYLSRYEDVRDLLVTTFERIPDHPSAARAQLLLELAVSRWFEGNWAATADHAAEARRVARQSGDTAQGAWAQSMLVLSSFAEADVGDASRELGGATELFEQLDAEELVHHLNVGLWLAAAELYLERFSDAGRHIARGLHLAREAGQLHIVLQFHVLLSGVQVQTGELGPARQSAAEAVEIARLLEFPNLTAWARGTDSWSALRQGDLTDAITAGEEVERAGDEVPGAMSVGGTCALAEARVESGSIERGRDGLIGAYGDELAGIPLGFEPWACEVLTRAELGIGRIDEAERWATQAERAAGRFGLGRDVCAALTARALVALARGGYAAAKDSAERAASSGDAASVPIPAARARLIAGQAEALRGDRDAAIAILDPAHAELRGRGARRYANEAEQLLRSLGRPVSRGGGALGDAEGMAALSGREREVAELVTERLTNREIAARLFLSEKTIERHLSHIFDKLGVRSRVDVAREFERSRVAAGHRSAE